MADATGAMVVAEVKVIALPIFIFTLVLVVVTGVLLWGLRILQGVLQRPDPDNPKLWFIDKALSEKRLVRAVDPPPQPNPAPNPAPSQPAGQKSDFGRLLAAASLVLLHLAVTHARAQAAPVAPSNPQLIEVLIVESSRPVTFSRSFEVSWPENWGNATWRLDDWKGPASKQPETLPEVKTTPVKPGKLRIEVTVKDVAAIGIHAGQLVLTPEAGEALGTKTIDLRFVTTFKPGMLIAPAGAVALKVSNCSWPCLLTELFAPETQGRNYAFEVKNTSPAPIDVNVKFTALGITPVAPVFRLRRTLFGEEKGADVLDLQDIPPNGSATMHARIENATDLPAGTYSGTMQFLATPSSIRGVGDYLVGDRATDGSFVVRNAVRTDVAANVQVRAAALWALVAVFLGVLAGRVVAVLATAGFEQKLLYYPRYEALRGKLASLPSSVRTYLEAYLKDAWDAVLEGGNATANSQAFSKLERQFMYAEQAQGLRGEILQHLPATDQPAANAEVDKALVEIAKRAPDFDAVIKLLAVVRQLLDQRVPGFAATAEAEEDARQARLQPPRQPSRIERLLSLLAGTGTEGVGLYYQYLRPLMHFTVLLVLVLYGVWQHYSGGADAATFGSQGISQYAMLFLWGVSADIVNKTLQSISFKRTTP